jgi:UDP-glucuronate decarboxylase
VARSYGTRKRILVTGGAGFFGSDLIDRRLLSNLHEAFCVDNLFAGTKRNMEHLLTNPRFEFMRHDVTFPLYVEVDEIYRM